MISNAESATDPEEKKLRYPRSVAFIIGNEFCERFCFYGMRAILPLYLDQRLGYSEQKSTVVFHVFTTLVYSTCLIGAILSDSWLGRYRTILYLSVVYAFGCAFISFGAVPPLKLPAEPMTMLGLAVIAIGSGGIKPCVVAFGGDQFKLPEQDKQMVIFFSIFYYSINMGALISTVVTPVFREDVHCFQRTDCYSLAFGVPGILMFVSLVMFVGAKHLYKIVITEGNMIAKVVMCIWSAIVLRCRKSEDRKRDHWLDYAGPKFDSQLINDTKVLLKIMFVFLPIPLFWSLYEQQSSRWTFQAARLNGHIGYFVIKPDQIQVLNPIFILMFIPIFDLFFYPLLAKIGVRRPLQKMAIGGFLAALAFMISGILDIQIERNSPAIALSMLWQLPQYLAISLGEIMFSVTGMIFSYSHAPSSMKSVIQAIWLLTVAFGNLIDVLIIGLLRFKTQSAEYFLFAVLMTVDMLVFIVIAYKYVPSDNVGKPANPESN